MTDEQMAALRALAERATPGPWAVEQALPFNVLSQAANMTVARTAIVEGPDGQAQEDANAAYIAAAHPAAVLALLDENARLTTALATARANALREAAGEVDVWLAHFGVLNPSFKAGLRDVQAAILSLIPEPSA